MEAFDSTPASAAHSNMDDALQFLRAFAADPDLRQLTDQCDKLESVATWASGCAEASLQPAAATGATHQSLLVVQQYTDAPELLISCVAKSLELLSADGLLQQAHSMRSSPTMPSAALSLQATTAKLTACATLCNIMTDCLNACTRLPGLLDTPSALKELLDKTGVLPQLAAACTQLTTTLQRQQQQPAGQQQAAAAAPSFNSVLHLSSALLRAWSCITNASSAPLHTCSAASLLTVSGMAMAVLQCAPPQAPVSGPAAAARSTAAEPTPSASAPKPSMGHSGASSNASDSATAFRQAWQSAASSAVLFAEQVVLVLGDSAAAVDPHAAASVQQLLASGTLQQLLPLSLALLAREMYMQQEGESQVTVPVPQEPSDPATVAPATAQGHSSKHYDQLPVPPFHERAFLALGLPRGVDSNAFLGLPEAEAAAAAASVTAAVAAMVSESRKQQRAARHPLQAAELQQPLLQLFVQLSLLLPEPLVVRHVLEAALYLAVSVLASAEEDLSSPRAYTDLQQATLAAARIGAADRAVVETVDFVVLMLGPVLMYVTRHSRTAAGSTSRASSTGEGRSGSTAQSEKALLESATLFGELFMRVVASDGFDLATHVITEQSLSDIFWPVAEMAFRGFAHYTPTCSACCRCPRHGVHPKDLFINGAINVARLIDQVPAALDSPLAAAPTAAGSTPRVWGVMLAWTKFASICSGNDTCNGRCSTADRIRALVVVNLLIQSMVMCGPKHPSSSSDASGAGSSGSSGSVSGADATTRQCGAWMRSIFQSPSDLPADTDGSAVPWLQLMVRTLAAAASALKAAVAAEASSSDTSRDEMPVPGTIAARFMHESPQYLLSYITTGFGFVWTLAWTVLHPEAGGPAATVIAAVGQAAAAAATHAGEDGSTAINASAAAVASAPEPAAVALAGAPERAARAAAAREQLGKMLKAVQDTLAAFLAMMQAQQEALSRAPERVPQPPRQLGRPSHVCDDISVEVGNILGPDALARLAEMGPLKCHQLPVLCACNYPGCVDLSGLSEVECGGGSMSRCSGCKAVRYCSKACQKAHWAQGHKAVCQALQAAAEAGVGGP